jgi:puromycin-sensitive aminopeptidase
MCVSSIRSQDAPYVIRKLLTNRSVGPQVWEFVARHWEALLERYPANSITRMVEVSRLCQLDPGGEPRLSRDVVSFFGAHPFGGQQRQVDQHLERLAVNVRFVLAQRAHLGSLLAKA